MSNTGRTNEKRNTIDVNIIHRQYYKQEASNGTQNKASELAQGMYEGKESEGYISDLVNSYAWDTAIVFVND